MHPLLIIPRRTARKKEDVSPSTWMVKGLIDRARDGEPIQLETEENKYIVSRFKHKGFDVIVGKIEVLDGLAYKGFAFATDSRGAKIELETPPFTTEHEAGREVTKYINVFRKRR